MIKRVLILLLVVQAAVVLALAGALHSYWQLPWLAGVPLGIAVVLLLRLLISLHNFHQSSRAGSATPAEHALDVGRALRLFRDEFAASMLYSSYSMLYPLGWRLQPRERQRGLPVLLIHGYLCNSGYWHALSRALTQARISHAAIDLEPLGAGIDDYAPQVQAAVERLCAATGSRQVIIVGHSMGGLVARAWLRRYGASRIARVITLGTPHEGSALAGLAPGRNGAQMRVGSTWLRELAAAELATAEANLQRGLFTSIYSVHDNMVAPQDSSHYPGARNVVFGAIGHVALGRAPEIVAAVLDEIGALNARAATPEAPAQRA
jgi:triacylglycerol esterase/lipase EstA (alpha/beta hydrolase family)